MQDDEARGGREARQFAGGGYAPTRKPRLRPAAVEPPPLPAPAPEIEVGDRFGDAPEDGLRMLAALETLTSLEPDFCDDLAAEASVTIIERVGHDPHDMEAAGGDTRSLRERLQDARPQNMSDYVDDDGDETGPYRSLADEAVVEIVEIGDVAADIAETEKDPQPPAIKEGRRGRATSRFFKALSGR